MRWRTWTRPRQISPPDRPQVEPGGNRRPHRKTETIAGYTEKRPRPKPGGAASFIVWDCVGTALGQRWEISLHAQKIAPGTGNPCRGRDAMNPLVPCKILPTIRTFESAPAFRSTPAKPCRGTNNRKTERPACTSGTRYASRNHALRRAAKLASRRFHPP